MYIYVLMCFMLLLYCFFLFVFDTDQNMGMSGFRMMLHQQTWIEGFQNADVINKNWHFGAPL